MENEIKEMLGLILNKLDGLEFRIDKLESGMDRLESRMDRLESRMERLEARQDEIYLVVKAIEHNNQVHRAEIDSLKLRESQIEGTINAIGEVITKRKVI
ncbi:M domain protein [Desulfosporosinus sp. PR]|uniref:M domain protein n=1 Tax=Candidatus Desulfosporosinus nitrosoreducens TaxID=3401928 RepID=UPI0027ECBFB3|nr:M domain protein [Desulfosporosinus sp. PR]MDQ7093918.1 M domain protein [Desulfosporosinus sp. PR]